MEFKDIFSIAMGIIGLTSCGLAFLHLQTGRIGTDTAYRAAKVLAWQWLFIMTTACIGWVLSFIARA